MAINTKGRRRIVVAGRVFYWDYREKGRRPGLVTDGVWFGYSTIVRVVSEDRALHATLENTRLTVGEASTTLSKVGWPITPRVVRGIVMAALELQKRSR